MDDPFDLSLTELPGPRGPSLRLPQHLALDVQKGERCLLLGYPAQSKSWDFDPRKQTIRPRALPIERRFKCSRLQSQPSIDAFHFHHHRSRTQAKTRILRLLDLTFLKQGTNLVLIGNPGVGKPP